MDDRCSAYAGSPLDASLQDGLRSLTEHGFMYFAPPGGTGGQKPTHPARGGLRDSLEPPGIMLFRVGRSPGTVFPGIPGSAE